MKWNQAAVIDAIRKKHEIGDEQKVRLKTLTFKAEVDAENPYVLTATISTPGVDREGEVLQPGGMDASEFNGQGAIHWNHDYDRPIAKSLGVKALADNAGIRGRAEFAHKPDDYGTSEFFPDFARAMVTQKIVTGVSVGFIPIESRQPSKSDIEKFGPGIELITSRWKLLEWSITSMPTNPQAVITAVGKSLLTRARAKAEFDIDVPEKLPEPVKHVILNIALPPGRRKRILAARPVPNVPTIAQIEEAVAKGMREGLAKWQGQLYA